MDDSEVRAAFESALIPAPGAGPSSFITRLLGLHPQFDRDTCTIDFTVRGFMLNLQGSLHGGLIGVIFDTCMGRLVRHRISQGKTVEMNIQYLRAVLPGPARCTARLLKRGRTISFVEAQMTDGGGRILAAATSTWTHKEGERLTQQEDAAE
ncbi:PaaI family thioesterase [Devosia sp.]|uniref:PaaI family thioesterase n=1 Tax=Devosia sp. TaxID=1871048 RepID=UPI002F15EBCB